MIVQPALSLKSCVWYGPVLTAALLWLVVSPVPADTQVRTPDGKRVLLMDDFTWKYVDDAAQASDEHVTLTVETKRASSNSCEFGLRLKNNMSTKVKNVVPQLKAYAAGGVLFETVYQSFSNIKPTLSEYQEIRFSGIRCDEIERLVVAGADRCTMGQLTKYSPAKGECLKLIRVVESRLVSISK